MDTSFNSTIFPLQTEGHLRDHLQHESLQNESLMRHPLQNKSLILDPLQNGSSMIGDDTSTGPNNGLIFAKILHFLISLFTVVTNGSILLLLFRSKQIRYRTYVVLVLSTCFIDLLVGLAGVLIGIINYIRSWTFKAAPCFTYLYIFINGTAVSLSQIFLICLNRYLAALNSRYNDVIFYGKRKYVTIICIWIVFYTHPLWGIAYIPDTLVTCSITTIVGKNYSTYMLPVSCSYIILFILIIAFCIATTRKVRKRLISVDVIGDNTVPSTVEQTVNAVTTKRRREQGIQMLWTVGNILLLLVVLTGPFIFMSFLMVISVNVDRRWKFIFGTGSFLNSAINPLVYSWRINELRQEMKNVCKCKF